MATIIDHSETVSGLHISAGSTTIVRHDAQSPPGPVVVKANGVSIGAGSTLEVTNNATLETNGVSVSALSRAEVDHGGVLEINGLGQIGALGHIDIGQHGTVELGTRLAVNVLSGLRFIGPDAVLEVAKTAQGGLLSPSTGGTIQGFGATDTIDLLGLAGVTHAEWTQNLVQKLLGSGTVELLNAQNVKVGAISLHGSYHTSNFAVATDHHGGTNITFV